MLALITGVTGFVAKYLAEYLMEKEIAVIGTTRSQSAQWIFQNPLYTQVYLDLNNKNLIKDTLIKFKPNFIFHLSGFSSVNESWRRKNETIQSNVIDTLNLLEAVNEIMLDTKILSCGSSEEYGIPFKIGSITEEDFTQPLSPYGISKYCVGMFVKQYARTYNLNAIHSRTFNHIGVGQNTSFVTQDFSRQIVEIEKGLKPPVLSVGNLDAVRDFTDVKDVVEAYYLLMKNGKSGEIYNVCSNNGISIKEILNKLTQNSKSQISISSDKNKLRPSDAPYIVGDNTKIYKAVNWIPKIKIEDSLNDILNYYRVIL